MTRFYHAEQALLFPLDEAPQKKCTLCPNRYPATLEYFHPNKSYPDRLNACCRTCRRESSRRSAARRRAGKWAEPKQKKQPMVSLVCPACRKGFQRKRADYNYAIRQGQGTFFCSVPCKNEGEMVPLPDSIKEEYLAGALLRDIATRYNTVDTVVRRRLMSLRVPMRSVGSMNTLRGSPMKGKTHTEDARQKISEAAILRFSDPAQLEAMRQRMIQYMSEGKVNSSSRLEDRVALELSRQGFVFFRQYGVFCKGKQGYAGCVDFLLSDGRVIEVNGTYWHCDPRKYPNGPINETQRIAIDRHSKKLALLADAGIPVIEMWEIDLNADITTTVARALASSI